MQCKINKPLLQIQIRKGIDQQTPEEIDRSMPLDRLTDQREVKAKTWITDSFLPQSIISNPKQLHVYPNRKSILKSPILSMGLRIKKGQKKCLAPLESHRIKPRALAVTGNRCKREDNCIKTLCKKKLKLVYKRELTQLIYLLL